MLEARSTGEADRTMTHASGDDAHRLLYLDDLHAGQRFTTSERALDETQVIAYASQFDP